MEKCQLTADYITAYSQYLRTEERSSGTIEKYLRDIRAFSQWLGDRPITKPLCSCNHQFHAGAAQWPVSFFGVGLPDQIPENPAQGFPRDQQGIEPCGI